MKGRLKEKMKRREKKENMIFFSKKMFQDPQTRQMNKPNMFRTKSPFGRIIPPFFCKSSESGRFSFIYMIRIRFFGPGEFIQNGFSAAQYLCDCSELLAVSCSQTRIPECALHFFHCVPNVLLASVHVVLCPVHCSVVLRATAWQRSFVVLPFLPYL